VVNYIRGMFAFVLWDNQKKEVFVARDRFGEKPFYYFLEDNCFRIKRIADSYCKSRVCTF
jgi:asparagine synthase (glutamine-hydrolysing)